MSYTAINICNLGGAKLGGFGHQGGASGQISSLADTDAISVACNTHYPKAVEQFLVDMLKNDSPLDDSVRFIELDDELTDDDVTISDISVSGGVITITTDEAHGKSTGDTVVLKGIDGDGNISELNGTTYTITVLTTTTFTLDSTTGDSDYDYTEDSGLVSRAPEMGPWTYAFNLPSDYIKVIRVTDEVFGTIHTTQTKYRFDIIDNRDDDGKLILTNDLTNADGDGIYLEYLINPTSGVAEGTATCFDSFEVDAIATLLASMLAPTVGRNTDMMLAMQQLYETVALPKVIAVNQTQVNTTAKAKTNFLGGRKQNLPAGF